MGDDDDAIFAAMMAAVEELDAGALVRNAPSANPAGDAREHSAQQLAELRAAVERQRRDEEREADEPAEPDDLLHR